MQLTSIITLVAFAITGVMAVPGGHPPPPPPPTPSPPGINHQINSCSSGDPYCCSPSASGKGSTCILSTTQCNSVSICCNNAANGGPASQNCVATASLAQPVVFA